MDKSIFFLLLSMICFFLVLDEVYGNMLISKFVLTIVPSAGD